jgi:hypothetical protein
MSALKLTAKAIKATLVVSPDQLAEFTAPAGNAPVPFVIQVGEHRVTGTFNAKSLRRACAMAAEGIGKAVIVQGTLEGDTLDAAGISVSVPPPAAKAS